MKRILIPIALLAAAFPAGRALPHAFLDHAVPAVGATVAAAPHQVEMFFTQELEPAFTGATLANAGGQPVATGAATVDPQNKMELVLNLPPLAPGHYKVSWHALSVDTHRTDGQLHLRHPSLSVAMIDAWIVMRFIHFAAAMAAFGTGAFRLYAFTGAPAPAEAPARAALDAGLARLMLAASVLALVSALAIIPVHHRGDAPDRMRQHSTRPP